MKRPAAVPVFSQWGVSMRIRSLLAAAVTAVMLTASQVGAQSQSPPVAANAFITVGALDWAWASPCNFDCSTIVLVDGFRFATATEWAARPDASAFLDPAGNYAGGGGQMRCAAPWFDPVHSHCDFSDGLSGNLASGPGIGVAPGSVAETWVVRDAVVTATPEPATYALMGSGLLALGVVARRRRS